MIILGLTGSIGMGKSTTANMFLDAGIPVYDSDAVVHALYQPNGKAVDKLESVFPGVKTQEGSIDRQKLSAYVLNDSAAMNKLEAIVHPLVFETRMQFLEEHKAKGTDIVVFDIPLLFETGSDAYVDKILVVTAPAEIQKQRVLSREGMTKEKFLAILAKQTPDEKKRERADFIIDTSLGLENAQKNVQLIIQTLTQLNKSDC